MNEKEMMYYYQVFLRSYVHDFERDLYLEKEDMNSSFLQALHQFIQWEIQTESLNLDSLSLLKELVNETRFEVEDRGRFNEEICLLNQCQDRGAYAYYQTEWDIRKPYFPIWQEKKILSHPRFVEMMASYLSFDFYLLLYATTTEKESLTEIFDLFLGTDELFFTLRKIESENPNWLSRNKEKIKKLLKENQKEYFYRPIFQVENGILKRKIKSM